MSEFLLVRSVAFTSNFLTWWITSRSWKNLVKLGNSLDLIITAGSLDHGLSRSNSMIAFGWISKILNAGATDDRRILSETSNAARAARSERFELGTLPVPDLLTVLTCSFKAASSARVCLLWFLSSWETRGNEKFVTILIKKGKSAPFSALLNKKYFKKYAKIFTLARLNSNLARLSRIRIEEIEENKIFSMYVSCWMVS